jgi:hypothetical protein
MQLDLPKAFASLRSLDYDGIFNNRFDCFVRSLVLNSQLRLLLPIRHPTSR